jgi:serine/threonine-protein kinase
MAPEQARGRPDLVDCRTDVYGLGAMLYFLLTGKPPFVGATVKQVLEKVCNAEPDSPRQVWSDVPPTIETACLRAIAKNPSDRFASANDLAREVERWQEVQRKEATEALRASEELYHSLVECSSLNVWRKDFEG